MVIHTLQLKSSCFLSALGCGHDHLSDCLFLTAFDVIVLVDNATVLKVHGLIFEHLQSHI